MIRVANVNSVDKTKNCINICGPIVLSRLEKIFHTVSRESMFNICGPIVLSQFEKIFDTVIRVNVFISAVR